MVALFLSPAEASLLALQAGYKLMEVPRKKYPASHQRPAAILPKFQCLLMLLMLAA